MLYQPLKCYQATPLKRKTPGVLCLGSFPEISCKTHIRISVYWNKRTPLSRLWSAGWLTASERFCAHIVRRAAWKRFSSSAYPCKLNLEPSSSGELLLPSARDHAVALPLNTSSTRATQFSPFIPCTDQSAEKQTQKDRLQLLCPF